VCFLAGDWFCPICVERIQQEHEQQLQQQQKESNKIITTEEHATTSQPVDSVEDMELQQQHLQDEPTDVDMVEAAVTNSHEELERPASKISRYSPTKSCPFPGCDGSGNIKPNSNAHFSLNCCPIAREEKKREKELLVRSISLLFFSQSKH